MNNKHRDIMAKIGELEHNDSFFQNICDILVKDLPHFDWAGFYMLDKEDRGMLELTAFCGAPTEHVRIPVGMGICGRAVKDRVSMVIPDVSAETNYLTCSPDVKSEIVVPIFVDFEVIGEIDIDSHLKDPFTADDKALVEEIALLAGRRLGEGG